MSNMILDYLMSLVRRGSGCRALWGHIGLGQPTVHDEVGGIDKTTFIRGQKDGSIGLLDGLTETAGREMDLTPESLGLVIAKEILQHWCAGGYFVSHLHLRDQGNGPKLT